MSFTLPNPTAPTNGQLGDATPILQNETAIAQAIASFDGSQVQAGTIVEAAFSNSVNPRLRGSEIMASFVYSGCLWSLVSGFSGTMTGGTIYVNGYRTVVSGVGSNTFAASSDTYVYIDYLGNVTYQAVSNSANSPSAVASAILVAIVVTNGSTITSINQGSIAATAPIVSSNLLTTNDSLGNLIYPTDPNGRVLGFRKATASQGTASTPKIQATSLSCPVIIPTGRNIKVTAYEPQITSDSGALNAYLSIWDGVVASGTQYQETTVTISASAFALALQAEAQITLTAGLHTINAGIRVSASSASYIASSTAPAFIRVELA